MAAGLVRGAAFGLLLGVATAAFGADDHEDPTLTPPATEDILPVPVAAATQVVSAIQRLRLHPGRDYLSPADAARNRPPADEPDAATR